MARDDEAMAMLGSGVEVAALTPRSFTELYASEFLALVRLATLLTGRVEAASPRRPKP